MKFCSNSKVLPFDSEWNNLWAIFNLLRPQLPQLLRLQHLKCCYNRWIQPSERACCILQNHHRHHHRHRHPVITRSSTRAYKFWTRKSDRYINRKRAHQNVVGFLRLTHKKKLYKSATFARRRQPPRAIVVICVGSVLEDRSFYISF